jgi:hypothetical protein
VKVVIRRGVHGVARGYRDVDHRDDHNGHVGLPIPQRSHRLQGVLAAGGMSTRTVNAPPRTAQLWMHLIDAAECLTTGRAPPWLPSTVKSPGVAGRGIEFGAQGARSAAEQRCRWKSREASTPSCYPGQPDRGEHESRDRLAQSGLGEDPPWSPSRGVSSDRDARPWLGFNSGGSPDAGVRSARPVAM